MVLTPMFIVYVLIFCWPGSAWLFFVRLIKLLILNRIGFIELFYCLVAGESDHSDHSEPLLNDEVEVVEDEEDEEMNIPLSRLGAEQEPANALLALLEGRGSNPNKGPTVHVDIQQILSVFLTKGLDNETRKLAIDSYPLLRDCSALNPPDLNAEIKICLSSAVLRQDAFLVKVQNQLATALSALAVPFNDVYEASKSNPAQTTDQELKKAGDPVKLIADVFHSISCHRRYLIVPSLDPSIKDALDACPVDSLLFGVDFPEKLKISKEAKKLGASLKKKPPKFSRPAQNVPTQSLAVAGSSSATRYPSQAKNRSSFLGSGRSPVKSRYKKEQEGMRKYPYQKRQDRH